MSESALGARRRQDASLRKRSGQLLKPSPLVLADPLFSNGNGPQLAQVNLAQSVRLALMLTPKAGGSFQKQAEEVLHNLATALSKHPPALTVTSQTVFLKNPEDQPRCEEMFAGFFGEKMPVTTYVHQAPCCGSALALESWAVGGPTLEVKRFGPNAVSLKYNGVRWIYCGGITPSAGISGVYDQTLDALQQLGRALEKAGTTVEHIARTWFYLGGITDPEGDVQRYQEFNRARTDFYRGLQFNERTLLPGSRRPVYPASTGIGMNGRGLTLSCTAFETDRKDAFLLPLENPQQTPAYHYHPKYSPQSPKFSRAMALVTADWTVTWVSGTASVINSESCHLGDIEKQTEQTIDNIEALISRDNFAAASVGGAGAGLSDLAKVRIYLKRQEDFKKCRAICERRFGSVPTIFAIADVCRPELLVEIEGVAFSARSISKQAGI